MNDPLMNDPSYTTGNEGDPPAPRSFRDEQVDAERAALEEAGQAEQARAGYDPSAPAEPPAKSAPKQEWVEHAQAQGDPDAEDKTKAELIEQHGESA